MFLYVGGYHKDGCAGGDGMVLCCAGGDGVVMIVMGCYDLHSDNLLAYYEVVIL